MTDRERIKIEKKKKELRTRGSSRMISEGGLGADTYYDIKRKHVKENGEEKEEEEEEEEE